MTQHFRPPVSMPTGGTLKQYLTRVLPPPGDAYINVHYAFMPKDGLRPGQEKLPWNGRACKSVDDLINTAAWLQGLSDTRDMWVCMTTQREAQATTSKKGRPYNKAVRLAENAVAVKSLWLDLDVEVGNPKKYDTFDDAVAGLTKFIADSGMPGASVLVQSGGGLHVYWTFDRVLTPQEWYPLACALTAAGDKHGLRFDHVTTDAARVLRLPGTLNYKTDPPRHVKLLGTGKDYTVEFITKVLEPYKVDATFLDDNSAYAFIEDPAKFPRRAPITGQCDLSAGIETAMSRDQVRRCLDAIPNDKTDWNFWNTVGMRVFAATDGAEYGLEEWQRWSDTNKGITNATDNCSDRWKTLHSSPPSRTGAGALIC